MNNPAPGNGLHIAIVGSGAAAFAAAIEAVERGARVTLIEAAGVIGGTCVNSGCVPSKILLRAAQLAFLQGHHGVAGVARHRPQIDRRAMLLQQQQLVGQLRHTRYENILAANPGITLLRGHARFLDADTLAVTLADGGEREIRPDRILLAVGSRPAIPAIEGLSATPFWTSDQALLAEELPARLVVLGGSSVALELAQAFARLGSAVTVLARSRLLSRHDCALGDSLQRCLEAEGLRIELHTTPAAVHHDRRGFLLRTPAGELRCDRLLVATGRRSNADSLAPEQAGIELDRHGDIVVDSRQHTGVGHIYAAGDCTCQPRYVYVAATAGTRAARNMTGADCRLELDTLPVVVFTDPQVATVGLSEAQARERGLEAGSRTLPLDQIPRALADRDTRGFIRLVADNATGRLLGCQVLAAAAGEIIQTAALAIRQHMSVDELAEQLFPYLTLSEGLKLCARSFSRDMERLSCCAG